MSIDNLLNQSSLFENAPDFGSWREEDYLPATQKGIELAKKRIDDLKKNPEEPDFENTILALEHADEELGRVLSVFYALYSAHTNDKIDALSQEIGPITASFSNDILLDADLFKRVDAIWQKRDTLNLEPDQYMLLENSWQSFARNGAKLPADKQDQLRKIDEELSKLTPQFSQNVLKSQNSFEYLTADENEINGLPETAIAGAKQAAEDKGKEGYLFTLDMPSYIPVMQFADNRDLREKLWRAYANIAFQDENDNLETLKKIVSLRNERAALLGYDTHADYVLERRMAKSKKTVQDFIERMIKAAKETALKELEELKKFATNTSDLNGLKPWDIGYFAEKLKQEKFQFSSEDFRPYFPLDNVIEGMFEHAAKLYNISFEEATGALPGYQEDVRVFKIHDKDHNDLAGIIYVDLFPRASKKNGAWQTTFRSQGYEEGHIRRPIVSIVCNFTKPTKDKPSLLSHGEVVTLFHEFGHALHNLLARGRYKSISGTSVKWDFVELPSQVNENWVSEQETLDMFAAHYESGEKIPSELISKLKKSEKYNQGMFVLRQMSLAALDMAWHSLENPEDIKDVLQFELDATEETRLLPYEGGCVSSSFSHIFAGGYSAGYYSYMWAEVLDADAFEAFQENGLYDPKTAKSFKDNVLAQGGAEDPVVLYRRFRGKDASEAALLKRKGLLTA